MYCLLKDGTGLAISAFVYAIMIAGLLLFLYAVCWSTWSGQEDRGFVIYVELAIYSFFWFMMVLSHMATMCRDPGFIPRGYNYQTEKMPASLRATYEEISL